MNRAEINENVKEFFDSWGLYKKFVDNNIMSHQEMYQSVTNIIQKHFDSKSFSILDLGCGDSAFIAKTLNKFNVLKYMGIDLSEEATKLANKNLEFINDKVSFIHIDFLQGMKTQAENKERYDVVFTSYALHHYTLSEKQEFFKLAHALLNPKGLVIVVDVILTPHQSVKEFLDEELEFIATFPMINAIDFKGASEHILSSDLPETIDTYKELSKNAGLSDLEVICDQKYYKAFKCNN